MGDIFKNRQHAAEKVSKTDHPQEKGAGMWTFSFFPKQQSFQSKIVTFEKRYWQKIRRVIIKIPALMV